MDADKNPVPGELIAAMCRRAFGTGFRIESIHELGGGTFNTTCLITSGDQHKVVLRISPAHSADTYWDEAYLMCREHAMQPFFAPIAALMPKTLLVDFTHQLIERDYMFQTFIEGERWDDAADELTPAENNILWTQFGSLTKQIHEVRGEYFGLSLPGFQHSSWSQTVLDRLERTLHGAKDMGQEIPHLSVILNTIRAQPRYLDEIQIPRLLHGDLWLFNILIQRGENGPAIAGILDADRAWWGDPMADWAMFILAHADKEEGHSYFWQGYGQPEDTPGARYRAKVYDTMHAGTAYLWALQHQDDGTVEKAKGTLSEAAAALSEIS